MELGEFLARYAAERGSSSWCWAVPFLCSKPGGVPLDLPGFPARVRGVPGGRDGGTAAGGEAELDACQSLKFLPKPNLYLRSVELLSMQFFNAGRGPG